MVSGHSLALVDDEVSPSETKKARSNGSERSSGTNGPTQSTSRRRAAERGTMSGMPTTI